MSGSRWFIFGAAALLLSGVGFANEAARHDGGDGHLAVRVDDGTGWKLVHSTDPIAAKSQLRTSPVGVTRIAVPGGVLFLGADADVRLDLDARQIAIKRGRLRFILNADAQGVWQISSDHHSVLCPAESEVAIVVGPERPAIDLLQGVARISRDQKDLGSFKAPAADLANEGHRPDVASLDDGAEAWAKHIRSTTEPRPSQGLGQLVAKDAQSDSPVRLEIARYHVNVVLHAPVALVQIDQSFFNPLARQEEGTFVFNLPPGASVSRFAMFVTHDQLIEGELIDRQRADQVYTSIVHSKRDPAILEQIGDNLFRMRVFPIFARDTKRILLDYTVPLVADFGQYRFELPLMSDLKPIWDLSLTGTIHPPFAVPSVSSPTHPDLRFTSQDDGTVTFQMQQQAVQPPPSFLVKYAAPHERTPSVRSYTLPGDAGQHFVVTVPETMNPARDEPAAPTDVLVLVDTSRATKKLARARLAAWTVIGCLRQDDRVRIGCVDATYRSLTEKWCRPGSVDLDAGLRRLGEQFALGAAFLNSSLEQSTAVFDDDNVGRRRMIVYIGDGDASPETAPLAWQSARFGKNPNQPRFIAIRTGTAAKGRDWLMQGVTLTSGRLIDLDDQAEAFGELFEWSLRGMPLPAQVDLVRIAGIAAEDLFHDASWQRGRELQVFGRGRPQATLQVAITAGEIEAKSFTVETATHPSDDDVFTGRLWAQQKVRKLLSDLASAPSSEGQAKVVKLCQEWSLMSPFTAFLVLETEQDYVRWNIDRTLRHRYWKSTGALAAIPLPSKLKLDPPVNEPANPRGSTRARRRNDPAHSKLVRQTIASAETALKAAQAERAMTQLLAIRSLVGSAEAETYQDLYRRVQAKLRPGVSLSELKLWRPLADRRVTDWLPPITPLLLQFAQNGFTSEFLERHPHARELLRPVPEPPGEMKLEDFADYVEELTGIPVLLDKAGLQEDGVTSDQTVDLRNLTGVSARSLLAEALDPLGLAYVSDRHLLKITTQAKANEKLTNRIYPVAELIQADPLPTPDRLANPYLDADETTRRKIESRTKANVNADYLDVPLDEAMRDLAEQIGVRIRVDKQGLQEDGVTSDQQVTLSWRDIPADVALEQLLEPLGLTAIVEHEVLKITTMAKANERLDTRLYCAAGILEEPLIRKRHPIQPYQLPMGKLGGMGFGGGFFGGGGVMGGLPSYPSAMGGVIGAGNFMGGGGLPSIDNPFMQDAEDGRDADPQQPAAPARPDASVNSGTVQGDSPDMVPASAPVDLPEIPLILEATSGNWMIRDEEGGTADYFPLSQSMVIRQSSKVHQELADMLALLRKEFQGVPLRHARTVGSNVLDFQTLTNVIQAVGSGKWMEIDQEGGSITTNATAKSLVIRQTAKEHDQIYRLLTQLRRARYVAESLPYRTTLEGIDEVSLFDAPMFTQLPRSAVDGTSTAIDKELKLLAARLVPSTMNQRWRSISTATSQTRDFMARRENSRIELVVPDRTFRADGPLAAVAYPGLMLVEIDRWGNAVRQLVDASLPWLPHRSNEELAELFDVTSVEEDSKSVTLRFSFPGMSDTYLQPTFSRLTRQPVRWLAVAGNEMQFDLEIGLRLIVAFDANGNELERWQLVAEEVPARIPSLDKGWGASVVVEANKPETTYHKAREALRRGDFTSAMSVLLPTLQEDQPLLHFMLAWSSERGPSFDTRSRIIKSALNSVAASGADDLLRLMTLSNFPSVGSDGLYEILSSVPADRRSAEIWEQLAKLARISNNDEQALSDVTQALTFKSDPVGRLRRQLLQIELLLRTNKVPQAEQVVKQLQDPTIDQLCDLADLFARSGQYETGDALYTQARQREQPTGDALAHVIYRQAQWYPKGRRRWESLLAAADALPTDDPERWFYWNAVLEEAESPGDATLLGEFAATQKDQKLQAALLMRQADLEDLTHASEIVMELARTRPLTPTQFRKALQVLEEGDRPSDLIWMIEDRLRHRESLSVDIHQQLIKAYIKLGDHGSARRATSDSLHRTPPRPGKGSGWF